MTFRNSLVEFAHNAGNILTGKPISPLHMSTLTYTVRESGKPVGTVLLPADRHCKRDKPIWVPIFLPSTYYYRADAHYLYQIKGAPFYEINWMDEFVTHGNHAYTAGNRKYRYENPNSGLGDMRVTMMMCKDGRSIFSLDEAIILLARAEQIISHKTGEYFGRTTYAHSTGKSEHCHYSEQDVRDPQAAHAQRAANKLSPNSLRVTWSPNPL